MTGQLLQLVAGSRRTRRTETGLKDTFTKLGEGDTRKRRHSYGPPYLENATDATNLFGKSLGVKVARALQASAQRLMPGRKVVNTPTPRGSMPSPEQRTRTRPVGSSGKLIGLVY